MLHNRHIALALVVAPLLSLLGWWVAGELAGEQPGPAQEGEIYPLVEKSGCRYSGGVCELANVDFDLQLVYVRDESGSALEVHASHALEGIQLAVDVPGGNRPPETMIALDDRGLQWKIVLDEPPRTGDRIRLVARAQGSSWFGEAGTAFLFSAEGG